MSEKDNVIKILEDYIESKHDIDLLVLADLKSSKS